VCGFTAHIGCGFPSLPEVLDVDRLRGLTCPKLELAVGVESVVEECLHPEEILNETGNWDIQTMGPWICVVGLKDKTEAHGMSVLLELKGHKV